MHPTTAGSMFGAIPPRGPEVAAVLRRLEDKVVSEDGAVAFH